ncbi:MAG: cell division protein ZapA [Pseudomonadales bacterium]|nr:cell division protein ZapA [Pseudomonadales bacterium]
MSQPVSVTVNILGKDYQIACAPEEKQQLIDAASHLDCKMREVREKGNIFGLERIAVMSALNLAHELLSLQSATQDSSETTTDSVKRSHHKLDEALHRLKQLEI